MNEIIKFDVDVAELRKLADDCKEITLENSKDIDEVLKILQKSRTYLTKKGKELREESNEYSKAVIAKEKELLGIIKPEEDRILDIKNIKILEFQRKSRIGWLEERKSRIAEIDKDLVIDDNTILDKDDNEFDLFLVELKKEKSKKDWIIEKGYKDDGTFLVTEEDNELRLYKLENYISLSNLL